MAPRQKKDRTEDIRLGVETDDRSLFAHFIVHPVWVSTPPSNVLPSMEIDSFAGWTL